MATKRIPVGRPTQPGRHTGTTSKASDPARQPRATSEPGAGSAAKVTPAKASRTPSAKGSRK